MQIWHLGNGFYILSPVFEASLEPTDLEHNEDFSLYYSRAGYHIQNKFY
jgi:hypothetical protein